MHTDACRCSARVDRPGQGRAGKTLMALRAFVDAPADILAATGGDAHVRCRSHEPRNVTDQPASRSGRCASSREDQAPARSAISAFLTKPRPTGPSIGSEHRRAFAGIALPYLRLDSALLACWRSTRSGQRRCPSDDRQELPPSPVGTNPPPPSPMRSGRQGGAIASPCTIAVRQ